MSLTVSSSLFLGFWQARHDPFYANVSTAAIPMARFAARRIFCGQRRGRTWQDRGFLGLLRERSMPSPFPGMDPYLEHPDVFPGLHDGLVAYLRESLQPLLPSPCYADIGRRAWIEVSEGYIGPDVNLLRRQNRGPGWKKGTAASLRSRGRRSVRQAAEKDPAGPRVLAPNGKRLLSAFLMKSRSRRWGQASRIQFWPSRVVGRGWHQTRPKLNPVSLTPCRASVRSQTATRPNPFPFSASSRRRESS
ncbi:MAG: DUF4058 family protein [Candidatus Anammoximicrobium sp.]|nr:DUF4058 family protein [Candidatus Anammoximicrobium sp.]